MAIYDDLLRQYRPVNVDELPEKNRHRGNLERFALVQQSRVDRGAFWISLHATLEHAGEYAACDDDWWAEEAWDLRTGVRYEARERVEISFERA